MECGSGHKDRAAVPHCAWSRVPWSLESGLGLRGGGPRLAPENSSCFWWARPPPLLALIAGHPSGQDPVPGSSRQCHLLGRGLRPGESRWQGPTGVGPGLYVGLDPHLYAHPSLPYFSAWVSSLDFLNPTSSPLPLYPK